MACLKAVTVETVLETARELLRVRRGTPEEGAVATAAAAVGAVDRETPVAAPLAGEG